jgi:quercetin dioxygenase-like cupin family protein
MKHAILAACTAILAAVSIPAGAHGPEQGTTQGGVKLPETITPLFNRELPNVPGKALMAVEVLFPPGVASPSHTHPKSAFIYAYVLSGEIVSAVNDEKPRVYRTGESWYEAPGDHHPVTRNPSKTKPAKLLVIFIADPDEKQLVFPDAK